MASENKKRKAKNSYCADALKFKTGARGKKFYFYDAKQRKNIKNNTEDN